MDRHDDHYDDDDSGGEYEGVLAPMKKGGHRIKKEISQSDIEILIVEKKRIIR